MKTSRTVILMKAYRKYKLDGINIHEQYSADNPGEYTEWEPYTFEQFCDKAFDVEDKEFNEKFDNWFDEAKIEYRVEVTNTINEGNLRDGH